MAVASGVALGACFAPQPEAGSPCATAPCPTGLVCSPATVTCELTASPPVPDAVTDAMLLLDGPGDAAGFTDAAPDAPPLQPDVVLVQQVTAHRQSADTLTAVLPMPPRSGDVLVMVGGMPSNALQSVTGGGATWTRAALSTHFLNIEVWFGVTDGSDAAVTISLPGSASPPSMWVGEWSGLATPVVLDGATVLSGTTSPASAGTVTTGSAGDLVLFAVADGSPNSFGNPIPGGWTATIPIASATTYQSVWYRVDGPGKVESPRVSETSHQWDAAMVAFRRSAAP